MGESATYHHPPSARSEKSLRRSLKAIDYASPCAASLPRQLSHVSKHDTELHRHVSMRNIETRQGSRIKVDARGKTIRSKNILQRRIRREPSPGSSATTSLLSCKRDSKLPFSKDGSSSPSQKRSTKKFQRLPSLTEKVMLTKLSSTKKFQRQRGQRKFRSNHSPVTVDMAQEIVKTKQTVNEKQLQHEKGRHLTNARRTEVIESTRKLSNVTNKEKEIKGFRSDYSLGSTLRSPSHVIIEDTSEQAIQAVDSLKMNDFAFVKRSDGSYSFAIFAYRSMEPTKREYEDTNMGQCMNFLIGEDGSTKMVRSSHWSRSIRLVSMEGWKQISARLREGLPLLTYRLHYDQVNDGTIAVKHSTVKICSTPTLLDQRIKEHSRKTSHKEVALKIKSDVDSAPPSLIEVIPHMDKECLLISFIPQMDEECSLLSNVSDQTSDS